MDFPNQFMALTDIREITMVYLSKLKGNKIGMDPVQHLHGPGYSVDIFA